MEDLIKREDAIEELADYMYEIALLKADGRLDTMEHYLNRAKAMLKRIPSADRPSGEWLWQLADNGWADHRCSVCGYTKNTDIHVSLNWSYCPHCGSKMRGEHDD